MAVPVHQRVQKRREAMRAAGMRPLQIWVPDTRRPGFAKECQRQAELVSALDATDQDLNSFLDAALSDLGEVQGS